MKTNPLRHAMDTKHLTVDLSDLDPAGMEFILAVDLCRTATVLASCASDWGTESPIDADLLTLLIDETKYELI